jgi:superfamily I DNA/RNA helicase
MSFSKEIEDIVETQEYNDFLDKIECLEMLSENIETKKELIDKITNIFSDENKQGIKLSTIHKAKGLEADNVYILNKHLIPSKFAKLDWELIQEENLDYVACTRSKKKLGFIYDSDNMKISDGEKELDKYKMIKFKIERINEGKY